MEYETVWPTNSEPNNESDDPGAIITGTMIAMKDVVLILNTDKPKTDRQIDLMEYYQQIKCTHSLIDVDSFWRFLLAPSQRLMISLPSDTYYHFHQKRAAKPTLFEWLKLCLPNLNKLFNYECIDIVIHSDDHFSRVFVMNAWSVLGKKPTRMTVHAIMQQ